jgi:hypothetical protein
MSDPANPTTGRYRNSDIGSMVPGRCDRICPVCDAISPDYCRLRQCRWDVIDPPEVGGQHG